MKKSKKKLEELRTKHNVIDTTQINDHVMLHIAIDKKQGLVYGMENLKAEGILWFYPATMSAIIKAVEDKKLVKVLYNEPIG